MSRDAQGHGIAERHETLWVLAASPGLWSVHFMLCYITAAVWCGKFAVGAGSLTPARWAIYVYTGMALVGIAAVGSVGYRWHRAGGSPLPHDADTPEDRRRFMGFATLLLSGLSAVAVIYSALAAVFVRTCE